MWGGWGKTEGQAVVLSELPSPITVDDYKQVAEQCLEQVLNMYHEGSEDGWKEIPFESFCGPNDVNLYDKNQPDDVVNFLKVEGSVNISAEELFEVLSATDEQLKKKFERQIISFEIIERITDNIIVVRARVQAPFPVTNREVVSLMSTTITKDGLYVTFGQSINHPACLTSGNFIRAAGLLGSVIKPINDNVCHLTKITKLDPKGMIPNWVVANMKKKAATGLCVLRQILENEPRKEITPKVSRQQQHLESSPSTSSTTTTTTTTTTSDSHVSSIEAEHEIPEVPKRWIKTESDDEDTETEGGETEDDEFYDTTSWGGSGMEGLNSVPWEELKGLMKQLTDGLGRVDSTVSKYESKFEMLEDLLKEKGTISGGPAPSSLAVVERDLAEREKEFGGIQFSKLSWGSIAFLVAWPFVALVLYDFVKKKLKK
eukprot:TRINITY_DN2621_c0_g1_i1.p1 TRINITY_DN2621_c0_g1~~TRINITY_DN2621_c0_g1_i1.p1  ORF type:complete len:430 (+),score=102.94 TRINITY_DN2621_c0_g1_i1:76-1365(+)